METARRLPVYLDRSVLLKPKAVRRCLQLALVMMEMYLLQHCRGDRRCMGIEEDAASNLCAT